MDYKQEIKQKIAEAVEKVNDAWALDLIYRLIEDVTKED